MQKKIVLIFSLLLSFNSYAKKDVIVGGYQFPPFLIMKDKVPSGMAIDLIKELNIIQNDYNFVFKQTTAKNRYTDFSKNKYDIIAFENIIWGWQKEPISPSKVILNGGAIFIAEALPGRNQNFFASFSDKTILGIKGYHYKFANMVTNESYLSRYFNMKLTDDNEANIRDVINAKSPTIAAVTKSYLNMFLNQNPSFRKKLLISERYDQIYRHTILIRNNNNPTTSEINILMDKLKKNGKLDKIWKKYKN